MPFNVPESRRRFVLDWLDSSFLLIAGEICKRAHLLGHLIVYNGKLFHGVEAKDQAL
jgi:hypothetical protein